MKIQGLSIPRIDQAYPKPAVRTAGAGKSFETMLNNGIKNVDQTQHYADDKVQALASGQDIDIHGTMIALQEADITLRFAVSVRDKLLEGYQKIVNMNV
jgi:flagellar hook-basal body complex protein FliE